MGPVWTGAKRKFLPLRVSNPDRPTCRDSLYLLRCPALFEILMEFIMLFGMCVKLPMESSSTGYVTANSRPTDPINIDLPNESNQIGS